MPTPFVIRRVTEADAPALGRLGAMLLRAHYEFDAERFMAPRANPEAGYGWFLRTQMLEDDVVVLVAERDGVVVGYVYAGLMRQSSGCASAARRGCCCGAPRGTTRRTGCSSASGSGGRWWR